MLDNTRSVGASMKQWASDPGDMSIMDTDYRQLPQQEFLLSVYSVQCINTCTLHTHMVG